MEREQWRPFLKRWSEEWIAAHDPENDRPLDEAVVRDSWLGFAPATEERIAAAEARLGVSLPPSLREFLAVTDGWRDAGNFIYRLAGTAELGWLRDMDSFWIESLAEALDAGIDEDEDEDEEGWTRWTPVFRRALQLSLDGDLAVMFLDPGDVDSDGEWAGYWEASWSGDAPRRFDSFYDLMYGQYRSFHALNHPAGETRDQWDAKIEQARLDALGGGVDGPLAVLEEAEEFGRERASLLRFQMLAMLGHWDGMPVGRHANGDTRWSDPLFAAEILPLLFAEDRLTGRSHGLASLERLMEDGPDEARLLVAEYQAQMREPGFRVNYGNPDFDAAVRSIAEGPAEDAWPALLDAIRLWQPRSDDHIAPIILFADPVLAKIITEDRGREILSMPRGRQ